jgi:hypothetical protein
MMRDPELNVGSDPHWGPGIPNIHKTLPLSFALDWSGLELVTSRIVSLFSCVLGLEASYGSWGRKLWCTELHFLSVAGRKWCDVLECGTQKALTLVPTLHSSPNH